MRGIALILALIALTACGNEPQSYTPTTWPSPTHGGVCAPWERGTSVEVDGQMLYCGTGNGHWWSL